MNAPKVTKETQPSDIDTLANELEGFLKKAGLKFERSRVVEDLKKRAAAEHGMDVAQWESYWASQGQPAVVEPEEELPEVEPDEPGEDRREAAKKRLRGLTIDPEYFYMTPENIAIGRTWIALRKDANVVMNMLTVGPSGSGKTEGLAKLAREFEMPFYKIDCASITTPDKWSGHKEVVTTDKGPETQYVMSEHLKWLGAIECEPGLLVYDEINRLHPSLLNTLIPILDGSQRVWVPDLGVYATVHPDTMIAATANLGVGYSGTYGMDIALHDRFGVILEQTFPPQDEEVKILQKRTGIDKARAAKLVTVANQCRNKANASELSKFVSTRALIDWSRWTTTGMSMTEAAEATWVKKFSEDGGAKSERAVVRMILTGVLAGK